ncbi:MAG: 2-amino-4-hydroxy-6-hydroxymethyldihydropteridine diphosphokinase [Bacteroidales bacterium]|jgi:2-amino-4-hydroxy-6-hydroxymethyldihydropteridine diphosphokinase|nr:2-amino-4-hydroxy-6-hydroxymethyldihydropteridine diphosphokinase [Bacteroidales bacterium]
MKVVLSFGSNLGNRKAYILSAMEELIINKIGTLIKTSSIIETKPWGFLSNSKFLNSVALYETALSPKEVLVLCNTIEKKLGRKREKNKKGYSSRTIDIDILFYENLIIDEEKLKIPHPLIEYRDFVLNPLKEIIPFFVHPILNKQIKDIILKTPLDML